MIDQKTIYDNLDLAKLLVKNEDFDYTAKGRPLLAAKVVCTEVYEKLPNAGRRKMGSLVHRYDEAKELLASNTSIDDWAKRKPRVKQQLDMLASALTMLSRVQKEYAALAVSEDEGTTSRNRLSDEETKAARKVKRIFQMIEEDLEIRRALPSENTPLDNMGTDWIKAAIDLYLDSGYAPTFWHLLHNVTPPTVRTSDKQTVNVLMLPSLISETISHVELWGSDSSTS